MIAIDSSAVIAYLSGADGPDVTAVIRAMDAGTAALPPVVLTEVLSEPTLATAVVDALRRIPRLPLADGFWERAGLLRAEVLRGGRKARLADVLIAQACIDNDVPLITRDRDFRHFSKAGLKFLA